MTTVTNSIFTPKIDKELSKVPPEIATEIKESVTGMHCYINAAWALRLNHFQKMTMIYLGGKISKAEGSLDSTKEFVSIAELVFYTGIAKPNALKALKKLIQNGYLKSSEFYADLNEEVLFSYSVTPKIIHEYLAKLIRDSRVLKGRAA